MIASNQRAIIYLPAPIDPRELSRLREVFHRAKLRLCEVREEELILPVGAFAGYFDRGAVRDAASPGPLPEAVLILCGLPGGKVNELLDRMREANLVPIPCKAVLTDTNRHWNFYRLYEELCREREAMADGASPLHK